MLAHLSVEGLGSSTKHKNTGIKNTTLRKYEPEDYWYVGSKGLLQEPHPVEVEVADKSRKIVDGTPIKRNYIQDLLLELLHRILIYCTQSYVSPRNCGGQMITTIIRMSKLFATEHKVREIFPWFNITLYNGEQGDHPLHLVVVLECVKTRWQGAMESSL